MTKIVMNTLYTTSMVEVASESNASFTPKEFLADVFVAR